MQADVVVLGAGMVGVSVAAHLQQRGKAVVLIDRRPPGEEASFGNGGLVQREAVVPYPFPRAFAELWRIAQNRSVDVHYHPSALPALARPLFLYWRNSAPARHAAIARHYSTLIMTAPREHEELAAAAGATALLRPVGYIRGYEDAAAFAAELARAEGVKRDFGANFVALDGAALADLEPHLRHGFTGALHWTDPYAVSDPHALTLGYARLFERLGGHVARGDAMTLSRNGAGWRVAADGTTIEAADAVVALGIASDRLTRRFGYAPPLFGKRGYHRHFTPTGNAGLTRPVVSNGFLLAPMRAGIRLTTGVEFARPGAPPTPVQLRRAEPIARTLLPLGEAVEPAPWMGIRPCTPDMLPIIGPAPSQPHLWLAFGHAHQGFTLGPTTGRLLAEMMTGDKPFLDPLPFRAERFR